MSVNVNLRRGGGREKSEERSHRDEKGRLSLCGGN
jgi:hypothetical protein